MEIVFSDRRLNSNNKLLTPKNNQKTFRMDKRGFPIIKGSKSHGVTFKDQQKQGELQTVVHVECWKEINFEHKRNKKQTECCVIY